ncbi:MAG: hypothetical protein LKF44_08200 [Atopobiaceae bacterium]|jgi:hypothetical protein|nr:hypothetical protein [Atopobiaceae bacterium]
MRKVIDGHAYDSDKAHEVGWWDNGVAHGDLDAVIEALYRTKSGLYFVHGEGGARSRYAQQDSLGGWTGGESVTPLSADDARRWAEEHLTGEEYEAEWGTPDETEGRVMSVRVSEATYRAIRRAAANSSRTMGEVITKAVATCSKDASE